MLIIFTWIELIGIAGILIIKINRVWAVLPNLTLHGACTWDARPMYKVVVFLDFLPPSSYCFLDEHSNAHENLKPSL